MNVFLPRSIQAVCEDFFELIFPTVCISCQMPLLRGEEQLCTHCRAHLPKTNMHLLEESPLAKLFWGRMPVEYVWAYLRYSKGSKVQQILHSLKYRDNQAIGLLMGEWYGYDLLASNNCHFDYIIPVPLHPARLRSRGYNQSDLFAQGLSKVMGIPFLGDVLIRTTATHTQTRKARYSRWLNVATVFAVEDNTLLKDKRLLLVDDVMTTGATLEACGQVLLSAGCTSLSIATIAYAR